MIVLAVDPGKDKCGIAVATESEVLLKAVVRREDLREKVKRVCGDYPIDIVVLGDGTRSREVKEILSGLLGPEKVKTVDERMSTLEGRKLYFRENPPRGLGKLLPLSLQTPPEVYDHYVAVILARRYFEAQRDKGAKE